MKLILGFKRTGSECQNEVTKQNESAEMPHCLMNIGDINFDALILALESRPVSRMWDKIVPIDFETERQD